MDVEIVRARNDRTGLNGNGAVQPASAAMPNGPLLLTFAGRMPSLGTTPPQPGSALSPGLRMIDTRTRS